MLPIKIKLENFISHVKSELIFDFTSALIVGNYGDDDRLSNGSGKSSLLEAIAWVLFGESRHKNADDIVRRGQQIAKVELLFSHNNHTYKIIRTRNIKNSKMEVAFEQLLQDGSATNLTSDTNKMTDVTIRSIIKSNYEIFINSSYFRQNFGFDFAEGTFSSRQALIGSLLNLDKWNRYHKAAKEELSKYSSIHEGLRPHIDTLNHSEVRSQQIKKELEAAIQENGDLLIKENTLENAIKTLEDQADANKSMKNDFNNYKDFQQKLKISNSYLSDVVKNIAIKEQKTDLIRKENDKHAAFLDDLIKEISATEETIKSVPTSDFLKIEDIVLKGKVKLNTISNQIENIKNNDMCVACGRPWDDAHAKENDLHKRENFKITILETLEKAEKKLKELKDLCSAAQRSELALERCKSKKDKISYAIENNLFILLTLESEIKSLNQRASELNLQIKEFSTAIDDLAHASINDNLNSIDAMLVQKQEQLIGIRRHANLISFKIGSLTNEETSLFNQIMHLKEQKQKFDDASDKIGIYSKLVKAFGRDGVQAIIIDNVIEDLIRITNKWLAEFCIEPTYVNFITQKKNTKGDWRETLDIEIQTPTGISKFESLSGGERFRISFAIRLALSILQAKRMGGEVQILMLDEVSTSLDAAGLETFVSLIKKLEKTMKILLITHDDKLKEEFETILTVKRTPDGSYLER